MCFTHAAVSRQIYDADRCERRKLMRSFDSTLVCSSLYLAELHYHLTRSGVLIDYMKRYTSLGVRSLFRLNSSKSWFSLSFLRQVLPSLSRCIFSSPLRGLKWKMRAVIRALIFRCYRHGNRNFAFTKTGNQYRFYFAVVLRHSGKCKS